MDGEQSYINEINVRPTLKKKKKTEDNPNVILERTLKIPKQGRGSIFLFP